MSSAPVTLLFTDLVSSTELLQRAGDEEVQRLLRVHHLLLQQSLANDAGVEVKWLGDGLLSVFASAADAVRCAVAMQQAARGCVAGERLAIRVGVHLGEALRDEVDYFGTPVVVARQLCQQAAAGEIVCSAAVAALLGGQRAIVCRDRDAVAVNGVTQPVSACAVEYRPEHPAVLLRRTPYVGRTLEMARLRQRLHDTRGGRGGVAMLVGEPGIGKSRLVEEFADAARAERALVLWGRCYEGEAARPYGPFVEALADHARRAAPETLRADLGLGAAPLARLVPVLRERIPDIGEPVSLQPDEERVRLLDAVAQFLIALSVRTPLVLVLDDLHWADAATIALLRHVARFAARHSILVIGVYRDVEVGTQHPLTDALGTLPRETSYEHIALTGLVRVEVEQLLEAVADLRVSDVLAKAITDETSGNPFFIREVLLHLVEEGKLLHREGQWTSNLGGAGLGIPPGVRQVIQRRLSRLSDAAGRLLRAAAGFSASFRFDLAARVANIEEPAALDAIDEALAAQVLRPTDDAETFHFAHALVRHALYAELSPPRQTRLHRQIAETMECVYGERAAEHAAEIAYQYARSSALPGSERGALHAVTAADRADNAYAHEDSVIFLRMALQLLPPNDARRARIVGRLGMALSWTLEFDEAIRTMREAGDLIAATEGRDAAADYLADAVMGLWAAGSRRWPLASMGLAYIDSRRDITWVRLAANDIIRREAEDPEYPGIMVDTPERRAVTEVAEQLSFSRREEVALSVYGFLVAKSRQDILSRFGHSPFWLMMGAGEYGRSVPLWEAMIVQSEREGRLADAVAYLAQLARCYYALGSFAAAGAAYDRAIALAARVTGSLLQRKLLTAVRFDRRTVVDEGWEDFLREEQTSLEQPVIEDHWGLALTQAASARLTARLGGGEQALFLVGSVLTALERAPGWAVNYAWIACEAATALWLLGRVKHADVIERNLREKVLALDFRCPTVDVRLSLAHLCALQGRYDEAIDWFAKARVVLVEQGARPLRAIVDFDEALMYHRRDEHGDIERVHALLNDAIPQFQALGMTGWIRRAEALHATGVTPAHSSVEDVGAQRENAVLAGSSPPPAIAVRALPVAVLHHEGDYWTLTYDTATSRLRNSRGLHYLAHLLKHPGQEFHALDLVQGSGSENQGPGTRNQGLEMLDADAKAAYRSRLTELRQELEEAEQFNDIGHRDRAREEIEAISEQLAAAVGLGGRSRATGAAAERARSTVTKRIKDAIDKIAVAIPELADHLGGRVRTGTFCVYMPDATRPLVWEV